MKQIIFIILFLFCTLSSFSQRAVRDSIRAGNEAYEEKLYNAAESKYKAAYSLNPNEIMSVYNLANTYYRQNKWDEAIKEYESYVKMETKPSKAGMAYHNLGNSYLKKKDLQKSMEAYKNALRRNPDDESARYNLAVVQKMIKDQQDKDQDKDKDKDKDQDKDKDKDKDKDDKKEDDKKDQDKDKQNKDKENKQEPPKDKEGQMSSDNIEQILKAMEQEEKATQARIRDEKAKAQKERNAQNRQQDKDW
ncbi:tetratricopeptide repeat protein [Dysgonomonas sp. 520]|uniref:tetratricopeptide repeat protein n=1 Tax=Dysgonomonas sp. 520 TaxID=2302931 RepID=UPI0013D78DF0|nr:tetratricopeptide repeat protein [Dysgonomonas sp. 520]NDW08985.1 tetratricopeptide repeat protein [Dysgonomonas sp. 520]